MNRQRVILDGLVIAAGALVVVMVTIPVIAGGIRTQNTERRTSNVEVLIHRSLPAPSFDVGRSMFDVRSSHPVINARDLVPVVHTVRFETVDVYIDAGDTPLAAYQFTIHSATKSALLAGLEGGEHPAFGHPPYYDKNALIDEKVIVAAYSTADELPRGRTRVARLHVQVQDERDAEYVATLQTAAGADGSVIPAKVSVMVTRR